MTQIHVEVVYGTASQQKAVTLTLPEGTTVAQAVAQSGLMREFPEIDLGRNKLGIWNKLAKAEAVLRDKDRVEIYRPLIADPKEIRRQRAAEGKVMKKGGGEASGE